MDKTLLVKIGVSAGVLALCIFILTRIGVQKQSTNQQISGENATVNTFNVQSPKQSSRLITLLNYLYDPDRRSHLVGASIGLEF